MLRGADERVAQYVAASRWPVPRHRAYRNKPLTEAQKQLNRMNSGVRCTVERVFGVLKLHYGMAKARYLGQARNRARFGLLCLAYDMKRGVSIQQG